MSFRQDLRDDRQRRKEEGKEEERLAEQRRLRAAQRKREQERKEAAEQVAFDRKVQRWRGIVKKLLCALAEETVADGRMPRGFSFTERIKRAGERWSTHDTITWCVEHESPIHRVRLFETTRGNDGDYRTSYRYEVELQDFKKFSIYSGGFSIDVPATEQDLKQALREAYSNGPRKDNWPLYPDPDHKDYDGAGW